MKPRFHIQRDGSWVGIGLVIGFSSLFFIIFLHTSIMLFFTGGLLLLACFAILMIYNIVCWKDEVEEWHVETSTRLITE